MRVLLAEDEFSLAKAIVKILKNANYEVDYVDNGEDALYYLKTSDYDIAILDIMMPALDGISVVKQIREYGSDVAIIMLTAKSDVDDKVEALDSGANDYLTKPFSAKELLARLRSITRGASSTNSVVTIGNTSLDRTSYQLSTPYNSVVLTNKEYQLMEMFMLNPKQIISSEKIYEKIWGLDSDSDISIIWVYVSYLRKKLTNLQSDLQIKSSRNAGYFLEKIDD